MTDEDAIRLKGSLLRMHYRAVRLMAREALETGMDPDEIRRTLEVAWANARDDRTDDELDDLVHRQAVEDALSGRPAL
jgi:hypothetical protein